MELVGTHFPRVGSWREARQNVRGEEDLSRWQGGDRQLGQGWGGGLGDGGQHKAVYRNHGEDQDVLWDCK